MNLMIDWLVLQAAKGAIPIANLLDRLGLDALSFHWSRSFRRLLRWRMPELGLLDAPKVQEAK